MSASSGNAPAATVAGSEYSTEEGGTLSEVAKSIIKFDDEEIHGGRCDDPNWKKDVLKSGLHECSLVTHEEKEAIFDLVSAPSECNTFKAKVGMRDDSASPETGKRRRLSLGESEPYYKMDLIPAHQNSCLVFDAPPNGDDAEAGSDGTIQSTVRIKNMSGTAALANSGNSSLDTNDENVFFFDERPPSPCSFMQLNLGYLQLEELQGAGDLWTDYRDKRLRPLRTSSADEFSPADFFDMMYNGIHMTVRQYLRLTVIKQLSPDDRRTLLKSGVMELLTARGAAKYNSKTDQISIQNPGCESIDISVTKGTKGNTYNAFRNFITSFPEKWRTNEQAMLLLSLLILLNPHRPSLVDRMAVERGRVLYSRLLKDYLESTYGGAEGGRALKYFLWQLTELPRWVKQHSARVAFEIDHGMGIPVCVQIISALP